MYSRFCHLSHVFSCYNTEVLHKCQEWWHNLQETQKNKIRNQFGIEVIKNSLRESFRMLWESNFVVDEEMKVAGGSFRIVKTGNDKIFPSGKAKSLGKKSQLDPN